MENTKTDILGNYILRRGAFSIIYLPARLHWCKETETFVPVENATLFYSIKAMNAELERVRQIGVK